MPDLINAEQAAERLGISKSTLLRRTRTGQVPAATKLPGRTGAFVYDEDTIDDLAAEAAS